MEALDVGYAIAQVVHEDVRFEKSDASYRAVLAFALALMVIVALVHVGISWAFGSMVESAHARSAPFSPLAAKERFVLPRDLTRIPAPRLEESEGEALQALHAEEDKRLNGYGWVNRQEGVVHIPIERALDLLAQPAGAAARGIKVRPR